jgi:hypothetical protein
MRVSGGQEVVKTTHVIHAEGGWRRKGRSQLRFTVPNDIRAGFGRGGPADDLLIRLGWIYARQFLSQAVLARRLGLLALLAVTVNNVLTGQALRLGRQNLP